MRRELRTGDGYRLARRILADFIIGAHALANGFRLLSLDQGLYRVAFPTLAIETF